MRNLLGAYGHFQRNLAGGVWDRCGEFAGLARLFDRAATGLHFSDHTAAKVAPLLKAMTRANGLERWRLFLEIGKQLLAEPEPVELASAGYRPIGHHAPSERIHKSCLSRLCSLNRIYPQRGFRQKPRGR